MTFIVLVIVFAFDYLLTAGLLALACAVLHWIGIFTIGSFAVAFSWKMVTAIWILIVIFRILFKGSKVEIKY